MVHALEEIHRMLIPSGRLVDIHPTLEVSRIEIHRDGRILFSQPYPRSFIKDYRNANRALSQVIRRGLFRRARKARFPFVISASSAMELFNYINEASSNEEPSPGDSEAAREKEFFLHVEELMQGMPPGAEAVSVERAQISLLPAVK
jgi:hypothetical protein